MTDLAIKSAQMIFPSIPDANKLLKIMTTNRNFLKFSFPDVDVSTYVFDKFKINPVVLNINKYIDTIGQSNQLLN